MKIPVASLLLFCCAFAPVVLEAGVKPPDAPLSHASFRNAADVRAALLDADSAWVHLNLLTESSVGGNGVRSSTSVILASGKPGREWFRSFTDALVPEGRAWRLCPCPSPDVMREDGEDAWNVTVMAYDPPGFYRVVLNLQDECAHFMGFTFDIHAQAGELRRLAQLAMLPNPDAGRALRRFYEPDGSIAPWPEPVKKPNR